MRNSENIDRNNNEKNENKSTTQLKSSLLIQSTEALFELKKKITVALEQNHIFMATGQCQTFRRIMKERGWLERKFNLNTLTESNLINGTTLIEKLNGMFYSYISEFEREHSIASLENLICSRLLENATPQICWNCYPVHGRSEIPNGIIINRIGSSFTNKEILSKNLTNSTEMGFAGFINYPRCYTTCDTQQMNDFKQDFHLTTCMSLLKFLLGQIELRGIDSMYRDDGLLKLTIVEFAINRLVEFISSKRHIDLDTDYQSISTEEWEDFLNQTYQCTHNNYKFLKENSMTMSKLVIIIRELLKIVQLYWPQYDIDGNCNIWILKPGFGSMGRNIHLTANYQEIMTFIRKPSRNRWVIQKYIEKPFLIHNVKFDIRVWFVITPCPFEIWIYKDCYLRFSSRHFDLNDFHEAIHLTNHCVQRRYRNTFLSEMLPQNKMWDSNQFQEFLNRNGYKDKWDEKIFPQMTKSIVGSVLSVEKLIKRRPNSFQLYGADFVLDETLNLWLIEINSSPDLGYTTSVTATLVPKCIRDLIKVVIDRKENPTVSTGSFQCIFNEDFIFKPQLDPINLSIQGVGIVKKNNEIANDLYTDSGTMLYVTTPAKNETFTTKNGIKNQFAAIKSLNKFNKNKQLTNKHGKDILKTFNINTNLEFLAQSVQNIDQTLETIHRTLKSKTAVEQLENLNTIQKDPNEKFEIVQTSNTGSDKIQSTNSKKPFINNINLKRKLNLQYPFSLDQLKSYNLIYKNKKLLVQNILDTKTDNYNVIETSTKKIKPITSKIPSLKSKISSSTSPIKLNVLNKNKPISEIKELTKLPEKTVIEAKNPHVINKSNPGERKLKTNNNNKNIKTKPLSKEKTKILTNSTKDPKNTLKVTHSTEIPSVKIQQNSSATIKNDAKQNSKIVTMNNKTINEQIQSQIKLENSNNPETLSSTSHENETLIQQMYQFKKQYESNVVCTKAKYSKSDAKNLFNVPVPLYKTQLKQQPMIKINHPPQIVTRYLQTANTESMDYLYKVIQDRNQNSTKIT